MPGPGKMMLSCRSYSDRLDHLHEVDAVALGERLSSRTQGWWPGTVLDDLGGLRLDGAISTVAGSHVLSTSVRNFFTRRCDSGLQRHRLSEVPDGRHIVTTRHDRS